MFWLSFLEKKSHLIVTAILLLILASVIRFYNVASNEFVFYDEGMYLGFNLPYLQKVSQFAPTALSDQWQIFSALTKSALGTAKALWFWLASIRVFFMEAGDYYFLRLLSALCGVVTIIVTFFFARRYYQSVAIGILAAIILAFLPSHVFYSRLAMQESFSTLFFVLGMYFYCFDEKVSWRTLVASLCFAAVFFTNYRMIILPVYIVLWEGLHFILLKRKINWRKIIWGGVVFFGLIFILGGLFGGQGTFVTFGWMFHQSHMAKSQFYWINLLSYPYYLFRLEGIVLAGLFFGNIYFMVRQQWGKIFPFALVMLQMLIFSLAAEKGARYLCVMLPFIAMASAFTLHTLYASSTKWLGRSVALVLLTTMMISFTPKALGMMHFQSSYDDAIMFVRSKDPQAKFLSTQPEVQKLFVPNINDVKTLPKNFKSTVALVSQGYHYLVIDPQAYISWTQGHVRFIPEFLGYLQFLEDQIPPIMESDHFNKVIFERFIFDHNEHLGRSIAFADHHKDLGQLRIYDLNQLIVLLQSTGNLQRALQ